MAHGYRVLALQVLHCTPACCARQCTLRYNFRKCCEFGLPPYHLSDEGGQAVGHTVAFDNIVGVSTQQLVVIQLQLCSIQCKSGLWATQLRPIEAPSAEASFRLKGGTLEPPRSTRWNRRLAISSWASLSTSCRLVSVASCQLGCFHVSADIPSPTRIEVPIYFQYSNLGRGWIRVGFNFYFRRRSKSNSSLIPI